MVVPAVPWSAEAVASTTTPGGSVTVTEAPPLGAGELKVMVQFVEPGVVILAGLHARDVTVGIATGASVRVAV